MFYKENLKLIKEALKDNYSFVDIIPIKEINKDIPKKEFNKEIIRGEDLINEALNPQNDNIIITEYKLKYKDLELFIYMNDGFFSCRKDLSKVNIFAVSSFIEDKISLKEDKGIIKLNNLLLPFFFKTTQSNKIKNNFKIMKNLIEKQTGLKLIDPTYQLSSDLSRSVDNKVKFTSISKEYNIKHNNKEYKIILTSVQHNKNIYRCLFQFKSGKPFVDSFTIMNDQELNHSFTNTILKAQEIGSIPKEILFHNKTDHPEVKDIKDKNLKEINILINELMELCDPSKFPLNDNISIKEISKYMSIFEKELEEQRLILSKIKTKEQEYKKDNNNPLFHLFKDNINKADDLILSSQNYLQKIYHCYLIKSQKIISDKIDKYIQKSS